MCRYCKGSVLAPVTGGRIVTPIDKGKDSIPRFIFETSDIEEPPPFQENKYAQPVPPIDTRAISFEIQRNRILLQKNTGEFGASFDLLDCLDSPLLQDLDERFKDKIRSLSSSERESLRSEIIKHNQWVTEFVPPAMACLNCNTAGNLVQRFILFDYARVYVYSDVFCFAVYPMGVGTSSKSIFVYCCLYLVKVSIYSCVPLFLHFDSFWFCFQNSAAVLSIVSLLHDAKTHTEKYPSQAIDSGSVERNTIHLMTRILNSMSSSCEYSSTQAVGTALGLEAQFCMHKRCYLYADQAIEYVIQKLEPDACAISDDASVASSFSSGIYSDQDSEAASSISDIQPPCCTQDPKILSPSVAVPELSPDEEFGPQANLDDFQLSDTDSDVDISTHQRVQGLLRRGTIRHGSVPVTRNSTGELCVVTQVEDYHYRPEEFKSFSLYEMVCMTYRRDISRKTREPSSSDSDTDSSDSDEKERRGRKPTHLFRFQDPHRLKDTHALALLKQYSVAQIIRKVPAAPGPRPDPLTDVWKTRARIFAQFILVVFKPWEGLHGLPDSTTWKAFCDWQATLRQSKTIIDRTRAAFIVNVHHNLKFSSAVSKILKRFRGSAATRWLDMAAHLRPKKWIFGDETAIEKDLKSKNTQYEAELAMKELLHKVCNCSPSETKKMEMLRNTIQNYVNAMTPSLSGVSNIRTLFGNDIPTLSERIDCFPAHEVERVHEHNLKQMSERLLADKTNQKKRKNSSAPSPLPAESHVAWSPQQHAIIMAVSRFLDAFVDWKNGNASKPASLNMLLFGGPGAVYSCNMNYSSSL